MDLQGLVGFRNGQVNRRELLRVGGLSLFGTTLPNLLAGRVSAGSSTGLSVETFGRAKSCILLFMWGGPSQLDTWDLKPHAPENVRGEFRPIATRVPGISISEHMPLLAQRADQLALIRSMTHKDVNHLEASHELLTGQIALPGRGTQEDWPNIGSVLAKTGRGKDPLPPHVNIQPELPNDVPNNVSLSRGQMAGWLGPAYNPLVIKADPSLPDYRVGDFAFPVEMSVRRLDHRQALLNSLESQLRLQGDSAALMQRHYARSFDLLHSAVAQAAFDLTQERPEVRQRYGMNPHGQSVLQARRLVERGVPLVTVMWPKDGIKNVSIYWDTHSRNFIDQRERLQPGTDQAFSALLDDLGERGLLEETLIVWTGEFGRTPKVGQRSSDAGSGRDGRDHWPGCFTTVLAGAGIRGGIVYGASDKIGAYPASNPVAPVDLVSTIYHLLGVGQDLILHDRQGRPHSISPGKLIADILA
jgi:hypothetical protein